MTTKRIVETSNAPAAIGPYSQAVHAGGLLFTSGQIPLDPETGELVGSSFEEQARRVMENLKAVVEAAGSSMASLLKTTCYVADMGDFAAFNGVYAEYVAEPFPARSCVQVARLPKDVLIEVEAVATIVD